MQNTIASTVVTFLPPHVALVADVRLPQSLDDAGKPVTKSCEETRIWKKQGNLWKHVHFLRSLPVRGGFAVVTHGTPSGFVPPTA